MDRNADCCVNTVDERIPPAKNLVNFCPVTPEIYWLICMDGDCKEANNYGHYAGQRSFARWH